MLLQKIEASLQHLAGIGNGIDQHVAILAYRFSHPEDLGNAAYALGNKRPDHDELAVTAGDDERKLEPGAAAVGLAEMVVRPVPAEIECLEDVRRFACAREEIILIGFE